jgi:hypothetical protein
VPTKTFTKYQVTKVAPWWFKRYVFFNKKTQLEPLFIDEGDVKV